MQWEVVIRRARTRAAASVPSPRTGLGIEHPGCLNIGSRRGVGMAWA